MTLRELLWLAEGRSQNLWSHTASLLALIANCHRDLKKSKPLKPEDFNPHAPQKPVTKIKNLSILKRVFIPPQRSEK